MILDGYLKRMKYNPESMQEAFERNPIFLSSLLKYRMQLWQQLKQSRGVSLAEDEYISLLRAIYNSRNQQDAQRRHPLYLVFTTGNALSFFNRIYIMHEISDILRHVHPASVVPIQIENIQRNTVGITL